jgi:hypothetical protein
VQSRPKVELFGLTATFAIAVDAESQMVVGPGTIPQQVM